MSEEKETTSLSVRAVETREMIQKKWPEIVKGLPQFITPSRMLGVVQNAFGKNPKLLECTPISLIGALVVSCELGLEINTPLGLAYIIPYENSVKVGNQWKKVTEAQFQIGYPGLMNLARRSGKVDAIYAEVVYANDKIERTLGLHRDLIHVPAIKDRGEPVAYYAVAEMKDASPEWAYITKEEAEAHALKFSKAYQADVEYGKKKSPWSTNFNAMAKKTAVIMALKFAPKAIEDASLARAINIDSDDAIDVSAHGINLDPQAGAIEDPRKDLSERAKALIKQWKGKIPGDVCLDDIEGAVGGSMKDAPIEEVEQGIKHVSEKAQTIEAILKEYPDWKFEGRAMDLTDEQIEADWKELRGGALV